MPPTFSLLSIPLTTAAASNARLTLLESHKFQAAVRYRSLKLLPLLISLFISACSSTSYLPTTESKLPLQQQLDVPFFPQSKYHCGPAALAGIFNFYEKNSTPDGIAKQIYLPEKKGSLQLEVKAAIRQAELLPYQLSPHPSSERLSGENQPFNKLLTEIAAGRPVLVLQNLGFDWWPQWHYAIVVGYKLDSNEVILHSGTIENYHISINTFINTWRRANYWALLPLPPSELPATTKAPYFIKAAADLESTGHKNAALAAYNTALQRWPDEPLALMGLGNINYALKKYALSVAAFSRLTQVQPDNAAGWNNLAYALHAHGCQKSAMQTIEQALTLSNNSERIKASQRELWAKTGGNPLEAGHCSPGSH